MSNTDLTSVSTHGWYTEASLSSNLTPISTYGWYYTSVPINIISIVASFPVEFLQELSLSYNEPIETISTINILNNIPLETIQNIQLPTKNLPVEYQRGLVAFTNENLPIEILSSIADLGINGNLPIDIVGQTIVWVLDRRGVLWAVPERGTDWVRVAQSDTWIINERGGPCSSC